MPNKETPICVIWLQPEDKYISNVGYDTTDDPTKKPKRRSLFNWFSFITDPEKRYVLKLYEESE